MPEHSEEEMNRSPKAYVSLAMWEHLATLNGEDWVAANCVLTKKVPEQFTAAVSMTLPAPAVKNG